MKRLSEAELSRLEAVTREIEELKASVSHYHSLLIDKDDLLKRKNYHERHDFFWQCRKEYEFVEPIFPDIGYAGTNGSAVFKSHEDAEALMKAFVGVGYEESRYRLDWEGPGKYIVVPSYVLDYRDDHPFYFATFKKVRE